MMSTRRRFLGQTAAALAGTALATPFLAAEDSVSSNSSIRIGSCRIGLQQARQAGLDGVEVRVGEPAERLEIADPSVIARYREEMQRTGLPIQSLMMGLLNKCPLATDPRGPSWLEQCIDSAGKLGARVILVAFFGTGDLLSPSGEVKQAELEAVIRRIKAVAPRAQDAGVVLALENYLDGAQNMRILDRINHDAVQLYFDVYNTGTTKGHDVPSDIHLTKDRIAQFHFKNGPHYLDHDKEKFEAIAGAIKEIGYRGWIILENSNPSKDPVADAKRNADFTGSLFA
jgi:sugar phosphate isomerase/epimerase